MQIATAATVVVTKRIATLPRLFFSTIERAIKRLIKLLPERSRTKQRGRGEAKRRRRRRLEF
jgi:hypothetical protein